MLLGKCSNQNLFLSFERDFKSYFPIAITKISLSEESVAIYDVEKVIDYSLEIKNSLLAF
jgi:Cu+-exporting ATPase